ncbi:hypothetical protein T02_5179 [Trichinella nativa]|uniref:Uncharacterized protein n=1 Tax=Trichinella nativa TaxID=6335 RepID=A0A0V1KRM6_9BILA|nr:hypothetical protein T02_5179 [Trichinella nativa]
MKNCGQTVAIRKMESNVSTAFGIPPSSHEILTITAFALLSTLVLIRLLLSAVSHEERLTMQSRSPFSCSDVHT